MMKDNIVPTDIKNYAKNTTTGVLINIDDSEYNRILAQRQKRREDRDLVRDIDTLKSEMSEIKQLLTQLVLKERTH